MVLPSRDVDLDLTETDHEDVARRIAFGKQLGPPRVTHHDANSVVIPKRFGCEIAKHSQMAMLTIETIFRGAMRME
jgi:hypothetical protein